MKEKIKNVIYEWRYEIIGYSILATSLILSVVVVCKVYPYIKLLMEIMNAG